MIFFLLSILSSFTAAFQSFSSGRKVQPASAEVDQAAIEVPTDQGSDEPDEKADAKDKDQELSAKTVKQVEEAVEKTVEKQSEPVLVAEPVFSFAPIAEPAEDVEPVAEPALVAEPAQVAEPVLVAEPVVVAEPVMVAEPVLAPQPVAEPIIAEPIVAPTPVAEPVMNQDHTPTSGGDVAGADDQQDPVVVEEVSENVTDNGHGSHMDPTPVDSGSGDMSGHDGHDMHTPVEAPQTPAEIAAFVAAVKAAPEMHVHDSDSALFGEHMELLDLVPRDEATHIAVKDGSWFDASTWHNGEIPGDDAKALIPEGIAVEYDQMSDARLFTVRVDGDIDFATDASSKMVVDTFVVSPSGSITIGTEENPVQADVQVDIVIANNGAIDTDWDGSLLSRGLISHGEAEMHGALKDSHEKVTEDPMAGDTSLTFDGIPEGWAVGDTIVVAGTRYEGYKYDSSIGSKRLFEPEDETRIISKIEGNKVFFEDPLDHDHDAPRADLHTSVANYSRNITISTEDPDTAEVFERGHVKFMHSEDVDIRYVEFNELGRTDKSETAKSASDFETIAFDSNVQGRYSMHFHRTGATEDDEAAIAIGNSVYGSPGWGFVHHDSHAIFENNATYDTFGAGFVSESGNETGAWTDNIAIFAQGMSWGAAKTLSDLSNFDTAKSGDGFWFQSRLIENSDNIAASVNHGFVYFHRGKIEDGAQMNHSAAVTQTEEAFYYVGSIAPDDSPVLSFVDNEVFAAKQGLHVVKANPLQGHDVHSVFDGLTAWSVKSGAHFEYTSHYVMKNFDLVAKESTEKGAPEFGIEFGKNISDMTIVDAQIEGFNEGVIFTKIQTNNLGFSDPALHQYNLVNPTFINVDTPLSEYDPQLDTIVNGSVTEKPVTIELDGPLVFVGGTAMISITGTKTDSLGTQDFPGGAERFNITIRETAEILANEGYFTADDGKMYFILDIYASDRLTGDLYKHPQLVEMADTVNLHSKIYVDAKHLGNVSLSDLQDHVNNGSVLVRAAEDFFADNLRMEFQPGTLGDGETWDDTFNWHNGQMPGVTEIADLNGQTVKIDSAEQVGHLDLGQNGKLIAQTGLLDIDDGIWVGSNGGTIEIAGSGQVWAGGYHDTDDLTVDITGGRFVNTGTFNGDSTLNISGEAQVLLGTGDSDFHVKAGQSINIFGDDALVGFEGLKDDVSTLSFEAGATLRFVAEEGQLGQIAEVATGAFGTMTADQLTGVDLGGLTLDIDVTGVTDTSAISLLDVDEVIGSIGNVNVNGLGGARDAKIFVDYNSDELRLELSENGNGSGAVTVEELGVAHNAMQSSDIWAALTHNQGVHDETMPMADLAEDEFDHQHGLVDGV